MESSRRHFLTHHTRQESHTNLYMMQNIREASMTMSVGDTHEKAIAHLTEIYSTAGVEVDIRVDF